MNNLLFLFISVAILFSSANLSLAAQKFKKGDLLRIATSKTLLKNLAKPFGAKILKTLQNGDTVSYIDKKNSFYEVDYEGFIGFVPIKSLVKAKKFSSFSKTAKVTETDMAAATKGFSPEVEKKNRENNALRYDLLDKAEADSAVEDPLNSLEPFRKQGQLGEFQ